MDGWNTNGSGSGGSATKATNREAVGMPEIKARIRALSGRQDR